SMLADNAPSSISVSLMSSALLSCASTLSESQATDRPSLSLRPLSFDVDAEFLLQIVDADAALVEGGISEQIAMQRHIGVDAFHHHFRQRDLHACDRLLAGIAIGDQLAYHRVVVRRHDIVLVGVGIDTDAGTARHVEGGDASRGRNKVVGVLGIETTFDGMTA